MLAELMVKTNPKLYGQYVVLEKGRSVLSISMIAEGSVWDDERGTTILQEAGSRITKDGI
jgi:hypothetical protein